MNSRASRRPRPFSTSEALAGQIAAVRPFLGNRSHAHARNRRDRGGAFGAYLKRTPYFGFTLQAASSLRRAASSTSCRLAAVAVAPVHVLNQVCTPPHAFEGAARLQGLGKLHLAPRSGRVLVAVLDGDRAEIASACHQCLAALVVFPATVFRRRRLAPVHVFRWVRAPSRTRKIAPGRHLDLARGFCDVILATLDRDRTKRALRDGRGCRQKRPGTRGQSLRAVDFMVFSTALNAAMSS